MIQAMRPSISALKAASTSLSASASNIANARNGGRLADAEVTPMTRARQTAGRQDRVPEDLYRPVRADNVAVAGGGVRAVVREHDPPHVAEHDPGDPKADEDGLVARPNVDLADEFVRMRQARDSYMANLKVVKTTDEMAGYLVDRRE
jgi:flagellar basal-body rod protein FlgC